MAIFIATTLVGLQIGISTIILGFASRNSALRYIGLLSTIHLAYLQAPHIAFIENPIARGFLANAPFVLVILYVDKVLLHEWTFAAQGPTSSIGGLIPVDLDNSQKQKLRSHNGELSMDDAIQRLLFGLKISLQSRLPATKWPVKNIPPFSKVDPSYIPNKAKFLPSAIIRWVLYVLLVDTAGFFNQSGNNTIAFSSNRIPFFSRVASISGEEMKARVFSIAGFWAMQYIVIEVVYGALAIMAIASGVSAVKTWPPMFGSISDCYSLRQFWGCVYHQLLRRGNGSIAHALTYSFFGLERGGIAGRYLFILITFAVSGAFHTCSDVSQGIPWSQSGAMGFFCIQTLGIMLEDIVQAVCSFRQRADQKRSWATVLLRAAGYVWVMAWLVWSTPSWTYPMMQRDRGGQILPFSILAVFLRT